MQLTIATRAALAATTVLCAWLGVSVGGTATALAPDLVVTAGFNKATYTTGDTVSATVTVQNNGANAVNAITAQSDFSVPTQLMLDEHGWGALENGVSIPAGGSVTVHVSGQIANLKNTKATLSGNLVDRNGNGVASFSVHAPVTVQKVAVKGQIYGDRNANGAFDTGEGLAGKVTFGYLYGSNRFSATTDSHGRFTLPALPTARYLVSGGQAPGWHVIPRPVTVSAAGLSGLELRAVRPLGHSLKAALHFTKHVYKVGDLAHVQITLTNTGSTGLRGIGAECDHAGNPGELLGRSAGWGNLAYGKPGVTLAAHATRTFDVSERVPALAGKAGAAYLACDFGYPNVEESGRPTAADIARVPGATGSLAGQVLSYPHGYSKPGVGVAGVRVVLVDATRCPVFTRSATTGPKGRLLFSKVPAWPQYELYFFPPKGWKIKASNPSPAFIFGADTVHFSFEAVHATATAPKVPTHC